MMFRVVCLRHRVLLSGKLNLDGTASFVWDTSEMHCPVWDAECQKIDSIVPLTDTQSLKDAACCIDRWFVVDSNGYPAYETPQTQQDRNVFGAQYAKYCNGEYPSWKDLIK